MAVETVLDFERRARLSVIRQNLLTPVRSIVGYQEIIVEQAERLGLPELKGRGETLAYLLVPPGLSPG
jgi:hypothetical protein